MLTDIRQKASMFFTKACGIMVSAFTSHASNLGSIPIHSIFSTTTTTKNPAAATPISLQISNTFFLKWGVFFLPTKPAISSKLVTTVGHYYMTLTLQMFIRLAYLVSHVLCE